MNKPSRKAFFISFLVAALLIGGIGSYYASGHPDGLEYVAEETGFIDTAEDSPVAGGPMADYQTRGVDNERLSGGLTGVVGVGVTLLVMGGIALLVRRRSSDPADTPSPTQA